MAETGDYTNRLSLALEARKEWLEKTETVNLKEELRIFQTSYSSLYSIFLKKKLVNEDPYKQEAKIGELEVPDSGAFNEVTRSEQLSIRLSNYDSQLDFLVNFYQFGIDFLNLERIKRILGLVRYINWVHLTMESQSHTTRAMAEIVNLAKTGLDQITSSVINESLIRLSKCTGSVIGILKNLADYYKECYKLKVRNLVTQDMSAPEANTANIKKKFADILPGMPFYTEFIEEIIKEDFSAQGQAIREDILKSLEVAVEKPKVIKALVSYKSFLTDGLRAIGSVTSALGEIAVKIDENDNTLANQKKSFWERVRIVIRQIVGKEPEDHIYTLAFNDPEKGIPIKQQLYYNQFRADFNKKVRMLAGIGIQGQGSFRIDTMGEEQLEALLERSIHDVQNLHRTLAALDDFFKTNVPRELRDRIRGIRPELASVKNAFVRANQLKHEYTARKEEEQQMKRLGITLSK